MQICAYAFQSNCSMNTHLISSSALASNSSALATSIFPLPYDSSDDSANNIVVCKQEKIIYIVIFSILYVRPKFFSLNSSLETIIQFLSICLQKS